MKNFINWDINFSIKIFAFTASVYVLSIMLFFNRILSFPYIFFSFFNVFFFCSCITYFNKKWKSVSKNRFERKVFITALMIAILVIILQSLFFYNTTGTLFSPTASDEYGYHENALFLSDNYKAGNFNLHNLTYDWNFSDLGYPFFVSLVYFFVPSVLFLRIIQAILFSFLGVLAYRIAKYCTEEKSARLSAMLVVFYPIFLWNIGSVLKETVMLFLILLSIYLLYKLLLEKQKIKSAIFLFLVIIILFSFRTSIAGLLLIVILSSLISNKANKKLWPLVIGISLLGIILFFLISSGEIETVQRKIQNRITNFESRGSLINDRGQNFANKISKPISLMTVILAPFPSFVNIPVQSNIYGIHEKWFYSGGLFIWNAIALFTLIGIYLLLRRNLRKAIPLLMFSFGYWYIIAIAGFASSTRFQIPSMPIAFIFAAIGLQNTKKSWLKYWYLYLFLFIFVILIWNYFQLRGRGII